MLRKRKNLDEIALFHLLAGVFEHDIYGYLLLTAVFGVTLLSLYPKLSEPVGKKESLSTVLYVILLFSHFFHQISICN